MISQELIENPSGPAFEQKVWEVLSDLKELASLSLKAADLADIADMIGTIRDAFDFGMVVCTVCEQDALASTAHLHQSQWIGDCCWDERLRSSE
jgi:hypothetical protein